MTEAITMKMVFDELKAIEKKMVTKEEMESYLETKDILSNSKTMKSLKKSLKEFDMGKGKAVKSVYDLL